MILTGCAFKDIDRFTVDLWGAGDCLRANSKLTSNDSFMPVRGIIFLPHEATLQVLPNSVDMGMQR
jgi:hypothetical protein